MSQNTLEITETEIDGLEKSSAILLRLTEADKVAINVTAKKLKLTTTEFLTKVAMLAVNRIDAQKA